ncbi:MAG: hypothetical protein KAI72_03005 [Candidatus Pacebacteria bacterium]|nr:hypothetical protein [Candidatus Paceibacterota bacterium]
MKFVKSVSLAFVHGILLLLPLFVFAQGEEDGCFACLGCGGGFFLLIVLIFIFNIALLAWVAKDAKNRNMDSPILWLILVLTTGPIGLIIYMASRTKGNLVICEHCKGKKLGYAQICPHCGQKSSEENNNLPGNEKKDL